MIILSGVLVVLAIALLVTGIVTGNTGHEVLGLDGLKLIYVSIGVSIISALCLAIGVFLRRKELFGSAESPASARKSAASRSAKAARTAKAKARVGADDDTPVTVTPAATAAEVPAETSVYVVPGRKRYHLETCRQLAGREKEELTFVEAREEGFTACTACLPDTALAARAALSETVPAGDDDPASVTRTDLPVTKIDPDTEPDLSIGDETDEDAGPGTREIPAAESPAAGEVIEAPEPEEDVTDTARFDEADDDTEAELEPAAEERPLARSRSLFEPLDRDEASESETAESEPETAETADAVVTDEEDDEPEAPAAEEAETEAEPEGEATPEDEDDAVAETAEADDGTEVAEAAPADAAEDDSEEDAAPAEEESETAEDDGDPDLPYVRILSGTKRYHRPDCALIEDIAEDADDLETLSTSEAKERGCTPCLVCQPDKSGSDRL